MLKKLCTWLFSFLLIFLCREGAFASMIGDAPTPYAQAYHSTAEWQRLGETHTIDDGVSWSVDGGNTWGNEAVSIGDTVTFQFQFWAAGYGNHTYDQLGVWVDTDQNGAFDGDERLFYEKIIKDAQAVIDDRNATPAQLNQWNQNYSTYSVKQASLDITAEMLGGFWLRARVHCNHVPSDIPATGHLNQGETEDWFVTVAPTPPGPVPEPGTMLLFGIGLMGFAGLSRKRFNS